AGHRRTPRVSVSRSIFPLVDDLDRAYFGHDGRDRDQVGSIDANTRAIFGRSYAAEPDVLVRELAADEAIAVADTLLVTVPNTLGVDYNAHVIENILKYVAAAPQLGWRQAHGMSTDTDAAQLNEIGRGLLALHKALIETQRLWYEKDHGRLEG